MAPLQYKLNLLRGRYKIAQAFFFLQHRYKIVTSVIFIVHNSNTVTHRSEVYFIFDFESFLTGHMIFMLWHLTLILNCLDGTLFGI